MKALLALLPILLVAAGCADEPRAEPEHPVVLVGFDGLEWSVAAPLVRDGKMPNLRKLIERGSCGYLWTERPALSPVCWTSIATGKRKGEHGITEFIDPARGVPFTSNARAVKALWNIASDYGLETLCVGWWVTWPAEEIRGRMVAPYSAAGQNDFNWKGNMSADLPDQTWPRELFREVWPIAEGIARDSERIALAERAFRQGSRERATQQEREMQGQALWSVYADETYARVLEHLQRAADPPDLTLAYFGATDVVSHRFWRYYQPEAFRYEIPPESIAAFHDAIERSYLHADELLGRVLANVPGDANVLVVSDHGFHAEFVDAPHPTGVSGHHMDGPPGVVVLAGPAAADGFGRLEVLAGRPPPDAGYIYDVAPVVLRLLDVPPARDMQSPDGGALWQHLVNAATKEREGPPPVRTHDDGFRPSTAPVAGSTDAMEDFRKFLEQSVYPSGSSPDATDERTSPQKPPR